MNKKIPALRNLNDTKILEKVLLDYDYTISPQNENVTLFSEFTVMKSQILAHDDITGVFDSPM